MNVLILNWYSTTHSRQHPATVSHFQFRHDSTKATKSSFCTSFALSQIPSRDEAKEEERRIRKEFGAAVAAVKISKNGKGPDATYTCAYTLHETKTENLF